MSKVRMAVLSACLSALCLCSVAAVPAGASTPMMVKKVNKVRDRYGLPSLRYSPWLARSSRAWGTHLIRSDRFSHMGIRSNRRFRTVGEILAYHRGWGAQRSRTIRQWMASSGHRAAILSHSFRYVGAAKRRGYVGGSRTTMWVVQLGARR